MDLRSTLLGESAPRRRVLAVGVAGPVVGTVLLALRLDTEVPNLRIGLWLGMVVVAVALAGWAGWAGGGALAGWTVVAIAILWSYVVPPLVAFLQGDEFGERNYAVLRPSVVGLQPYDELLTGLQIGPIVAVLFAAVVGTLAFGLGAALGWGQERKQA